MSVLTHGTVSTSLRIRSTRPVHSALSFFRSILSQVSSAVRQPIISSLPTFIGRHTAPSRGLQFISAASIRSLRPSSNPLHCGPLSPLPPEAVEIDSHFRVKLGVICRRYAGGIVKQHRDFVVFRNGQFFLQFLPEVGGVDHRRVFVYGIG